MVEAFGEDEASCRAMREEARQAAAIAAESWTFPTSMRYGGSSRWRVCTYKTGRAVVAVAVDGRFASAQARAFAEKVETVCAPMLAECVASAAHHDAARAMVEREVAAANERRLGLVERSVGAAASSAFLCSLCGVVLTPDRSPVNCSTCGDGVCDDCVVVVSASADLEDPAAQQKNRSAFLSAAASSSSSSSPVSAEAGGATPPFESRGRRRTQRQRPPQSQGRFARCADCDYCAVVGRRTLRLQPPASADVAIRFAFGALFQERAVDGSLDERGFVDLCRAAGRHPLLVDRRSLERETRFATKRKRGPRRDDAAAAKLALDTAELARRFRATKKQVLDLDATVACLLDACVPAWPERALQQRPYSEDDDDADSDDDDSDDDAFEEAGEEASSGSKTPPKVVSPEQRAILPKKPAALSSSSSSWWLYGGPSAAAATFAGGRTTMTTTTTSGPTPPGLSSSAETVRTGWGFLAGRDGKARRRVWLEIRDAAPRCVRYADSAAAPKRTLVYLTMARQIRREKPCVVEFRLRPLSKTARTTHKNNKASPTSFEAIALRFETPALTSSWWSALTAARAAAVATEPALGEDRYLEMAAYNYADALAGGPSTNWMRNLTRLVACGADCGDGGVPLVLCEPQIAGAFEGPERPFLALERPESANKANKGGKERDRLVGKYRGVVADRAKHYGRAAVSPDAPATLGGDDDNPPPHLGSLADDREGDDDDDDEVDDDDEDARKKRKNGRGVDIAVLSDDDDESTTGNSEDGDRDEGEDDSDSGDDYNESSSSDDEDDETTRRRRPERNDSLPERGFGLAGADVKAGYQALVKVVIRPPRATFDERRLGARDFGIKPPRLAQEQHGGGAKKSVVPEPVGVHRDDLAVRNERGIEVKYSLWSPTTTTTTTTTTTGSAEKKKVPPAPREPPPCVVYVHGNACSRLGSLSLLRPFALGGVALCAIDCAGSGNSGGEFVSLGHYERDDVAAVVDDLRKRRLVGRVALWGRSMGAATALLYASTRDPHVAAVVADSPYSSLVDLCRELVAKARRQRQPTPPSGSTTDGASSRIATRGLSDGGGGENRGEASSRRGPGVGGGGLSGTTQNPQAPPQAQAPTQGPRDLVLGAIAEAALSLVRSSVKHRAGFDIFDVAPIDHVANMRHSATPVLFLHGSRDDFVSPDHSRALHDAHGGDATLLLLPCDHQADRPASAVVEAALFVFDRLVPPSSDRGRYAALLKRLADDGYLGTRDLNHYHHVNNAHDGGTSGTDRSRQLQVECVQLIPNAFSRHLSFSRRRIAGSVAHQFRLRSTNDNSAI